MGGREGGGHIYIYAYRWEEEGEEGGGNRRRRRRRRRVCFSGGYRGLRRMYIYMNTFSLWGLCLSLGLTAINIGGGGDGGRRRCIFIYETTSYNRYHGTYRWKEEPSWEGWEI